MSQLSELPWDAIRRAYRHFRKMFFTKPRREVDCYVVDASVEDVNRELGAFSFAPNWEFSYNYRGEDVNLARVEYEINANHPEIVWWQVHVRGFITDRGIELQAHWEPEPTEHDSDHIDGVGFTSDRGMKRLGEYLEQSNLTVVQEP